jgi:1-phosphofructokinase family hexose kinase
MLYFLTVCLNPGLQKTLFFNSLNKGKVNRTEEYYLSASGKGINVSRTLKQLGQEVLHLTHAGGEFAGYLHEQTQKEKIIMITADSGSEIRICTTVIEKETQTTTEIVEESEPVDKKTESEIRRLFMENLDSAHTVIISGSKAPGYSNEIFPWMVKLAKENNRTVITDYRGRDLVNSLKYRPDIIKPNLDELRNTINIMPEYKNKNIKSVISEIAERYSTFPVITDGADEILYYKQGRTASFKPPEIRAVNTTGCGDSFTAGLALARFQGKSADDQVKEAVRCAALSAQTKLPGDILNF